VPVAIGSRPVAVTEPASAVMIRVAHLPADVVAAVRLRALARRGGHPAGSARAVDLELELDEDDTRALHLLAIEDDEPVATIRLLRAEPGRPLPIHRLFGLPVAAEGRIAELSRPALRRADDSAVVVSLLRAAYDEALAAGIDELYLVAGQKLLTMLRALGFRFRAVAGPVWAYGGWIIAASLAVPDVLPGLRLHQAVHGCRLADYFKRPFDGSVPAEAGCARAAG
jgi:N-acyl-L-homoserine lactone synthetase